MLGQAAWGVFYTLIFPGFLFTALVGLYLSWVERKVAAVIQSRAGPPWYQPYADILKLLGKRMILPRGSQTLGFLAAPLLALAGVTLTAAIVLRALWNPGAGFVGDMIVLVYLTALPPVALIIAGASSRSPFGAIGGAEMSMVLGYEAAFLLATATVLIKVGSVRLADILAYQAAHGPLFLSASGALGLMVAWFAAHAKLGFAPFDISEAETELIGGPLAEYSGVGLALFKLARAMMLLVLPVLLLLMYAGAPARNAGSIAVFALGLCLLLGLSIVVKNTHARLRLDQALRFLWSGLIMAGALSVVLALLGW